MLFEARTFWLAKDALAPDQYQDAFDLDAARGLAAIADGVTSAIFSGPWAKLLTRGVVADPPNLRDEDALRAWLAARRNEWLAGVDATRLTWYQKPKLADGGQATLLWLEVAPKDPAPNGDNKNSNGDKQKANPAVRTLRCFAIGDCCLFHQHEGRHMTVFPLGTSADFALNPWAISSAQRQLDDLPQFQWMETDCRTGDLLVLVTDALALWAVNRLESGQPVDWAPYWDVSEDHWREEIFSLRRENQIRYDDTTLVLIRVQ